MTGYWVGWSAGSWGASWGDIQVDEQHGSGGPDSNSRSSSKRQDALDESELLEHLEHEREHKARIYAKDAPSATLAPPPAEIAQEAELPVTPEPFYSNAEDIAEASAGILEAKQIIAETVARLDEQLAIDRRRRDEEAIALILAELA